MTLITEPSILMLFNIAAALLYALASGLVWYGARHQKPQFRNASLLITLAGFLCHSAELASRLFIGGGINLSLAHSISLVAWMAVFLYLLAAMFRPIANLGIAILPTAVIAIVIGAQLPSVSNNVQNQAASADLHLLLAVIAFGVLSLAFAQACLITLQDRQLRRHLMPVSHTDGTKKGFFFPALPPLQSMETILFQLLIIGFMLLTANLATGLASSHQATGSWLQFNHHILLTLLAWLGFGFLITGHFRWGWRGQRAARYTMIGFGVFILGFFGPRIVRELILVVPQ